jgi:putative Holliday junction resolvase
MRFLGVDPGGKRVGIAVGDSRTGLANPVAVIPYRGAHATALEVLGEVERFDAEAVVVGLPTGANGEETPACRRSRALAEALAEAGVKTIFQPEFLTTREARDRARRCGRPRGKPVDDLAALVLLEEYLANAVDDR